MYIERYLYAVGKYLPAHKRRDVIKELRSLIEAEKEELIVHGTDEKIAETKVLKNLGSPAIIASEYYPTQGAVAKDLVPLMFLLIRILAVALPVVLFFADTLGYFFNDTSPAFTGYLLYVLEHIPSYALNTLAMIGILFLIFYGITAARDKNITDSPDAKSFNPEDLPNIPADDFKVSVIGEIIALIMSVAFLIIINLYPGLIGIYYDGTVHPLIDTSFTGLLWMVNLSLVWSIVLSLIRLILNHKTIATKVLSYMQLLFVACLLILLGSRDIFNETIITEYGLGVIPKIFNVVFYIGGIGAIIGGTVDMIKSLIPRISK